MSKIWFITGSSSGFGRILAEQVLARGDKAVLTARKVNSLGDLVARYPDKAIAVPLDVTQKGDAQNAITAAEKSFGGIDVLVNNAGYGLIGGVEETVAAEYRPMFETNLFGLIEVTRAALPILRKKAGGRIVNFSSVGGFTGRPGFGYYNAAKFAVEGLSEALALEATPLGIKVIIVEPGSFRTSFLGRSITMAAGRIDAYEETVGKIRSYRAESSGKQIGDPAKGIAVLIQAVDAENPPLRLALGRDSYARAREKLVQVAGDLDTWEKAATATAYEA